MRDLFTWDERFIIMARVWAGLCSKDPNTQVGAVLVGLNRRDMSFGYNGFPQGIIDSPHRYADRELKHKLVQHAERNVMDNAQFDPVAATLYITHFPCSECVKSIVSKRIARVVCPPPMAHEPWASDAAFSLLMLREASVLISEANYGDTSLTYDRDKQQRLV